jgi:Mg2+-importing ATPase
MVVFGLVSSLFDFVTFGVLLILLHAIMVQFRTGWFIESMVSASMVVLLIPTRSPFFKSRPSRYLMTVTLLVGAATFILPFTPLSEPFGFVRMSVYFLAIVVAIVAMYIVTDELAKKIFFLQDARNI